MIVRQNCLAGSSEQRQRELVAVCGVLSAILAVEHRAVQPHLAHIWQLLWLAAQGKYPHRQTAAILAKMMMLLPCLDVWPVVHVQFHHNGGVVCSAKQSVQCVYLRQLGSKGVADACFCRQLVTCTS